MSVIFLHYDSHVSCLSRLLEEATVFDASAFRGENLPALILTNPQGRFYRLTPYHGPAGTGFEVSDITAEPTDDTEVTP